MKKERVKNYKNIITNHKRTQITNNEVEKFSLNFSRCTYSDLIPIKKTEGHRRALHLTVKFNDLCYTCSTYLFQITPVGNLKPGVRD